MKIKIILFLMLSCLLSCIPGKNQVAGFIKEEGILVSTNQVAKVRINVISGQGSGEYEVGTSIKINFDQWNENTAFLGWDQTSPLLKNASEWYSEATVGISDTTITAQYTSILPQTSQLVDSTFTGFHYNGDDYAKSYYYQLPPSGSVDGVVLFIHGTGGSREMINNIAAMQFKNRLLKENFMVVSTSAQEVDDGDQDGNEKIRWLTQVVRDGELVNSNLNVDIKNIQSLKDHIEQNFSQVSSNTPYFALGMSNGGVFSISLSATKLVMAAATYCAAGTNDTISYLENQASLENEVMPIYFYMCENDTTSTNFCGADENCNYNYYNRLKSAGVSVDWVMKKPRPIFRADFLRSEGPFTDEEINGTLVELVRHGVLNGNYEITLNSESLQDFISNIVNPSQEFTVPATIDDLTGPQKIELYKILKLGLAEHQFYDEYSGDTIRRFKEVLSN